MTEYEILKNAAGYRQITNPGYLRVIGENQVDFLNRQSTNDLTRLTPGSTIETVLTSPTAKILDVLTVFFEANYDSNALAILTLPGRAAHTTKFLRSRIFFMDKVTVEDTSDQFSIFEVGGPLAATRLSSGGLEPDQPFQVVILGNDPLLILRNSTGPAAFYRLVVPRTAVSQVLNRLSEVKIDQVSDQAFEVLRIEAGMPAADQELNESYTPLEMRLEAMIAPNKGCYTGQEIIARQITYDKVTRKLTGLYTETEVKPGSQVFYETKSIGEVTSFTVSPELGNLALAVLKRPYFETDTQVMVDNSTGNIIAKVVDLPFPANKPPV